MAALCHAASQKETVCIHSPGPESMALIVPDVSACSRLIMNSCPSEEMSFTNIASVLRSHHSPAPRSSCPLPTSLLLQALHTTTDEAKFRLPFARSCTGSEREVATTERCLPSNERQYQVSRLTVAMLSWSQRMQQKRRSRPHHFEPLNTDRSNMRVQQEHVYLFFIIQFWIQIIARGFRMVLVLLAIT